jgi:spore coat polysaccharide biosynthesis predicted glycosyltransferase SpsG
VTDGVLVRCDGTDETGLGHVSRCLALAEALAETGVRALFCGEFNRRAEGLLAEAGMPTEAAIGTAGVAGLAHDGGCGAIVVDSYGFDAADMEALSPQRTGAALIIIDDYAALSEYPAGARVLNFTVGAPELEYRGRDLELLLGPRYFLVRRAVRQLRAQRQTVRRPARHVLVALGGGDRFGMSVGLAGALTSAYPELEVRLAPGAYENLPERVDALPAGQLTPGYAWADIAVTGGGLTKYEAAYLGVPPIIVSQSLAEDAETQRFTRAGLGADAGYAERVSEDLLVEFVRDVELHGRLRDAAAGVFPDDPTGHVAEILVKGHERSNGSAF